MGALTRFPADTCVVLESDYLQVLRDTPLSSRSTENSGGAGGGSADEDERCVLLVARDLLRLKASSAVVND
jgi:hypothetical protein